MTRSQTSKIVLIVENEQPMAEILEQAFANRHKQEHHPYTFDVDVALTVKDGFEKIRVKHYDVIVLDIRFEGEGENVGLEVALGYAHYEETPVRIIYTAYPDYEKCIQAMRHGAWDFIDKHIGSEHDVVNSALARLRQLDLRRELDLKIAARWLPNNVRHLQKQFGGQLVALWPRPLSDEADVIANGLDAFELEERLKGWRDDHEAWEQPFIARIPPLVHRDMENA